MNTLVCRCHLPLYQLLQLLFDEGQFVQMQARLLSGGKLRQRHGVLLYTYLLFHYYVLVFAVIYLV